MLSKTKKKSQINLFKSMSNDKMVNMRFFLINSLFNMDFHKKTFPYKTFSCSGPNSSKQHRMMCTKHCGSDINTYVSKRN